MDNDPAASRLSARPVMTPEPWRSRLGRRAPSWLPDVGISILLGAAAFVLYLLTLAPTILYGDSGEFQFVPFLLGVPHPTGYPLYTLLGWAWSHLVPIGQVAYRMNLFSAWWAAVTIAFLYLTARALLRQVLGALANPLRRLVAALAALTFAVTPTFWSQALIAEVYSLHILLVTLMIYSLLIWAEHRTTGPLLCAVAFLGLGLAHHRTTLLLVPALAAMVWLTDRRALCDRRRWPKALLLLLFPLASYLIILWRAPQMPYLNLRLDPGRELVRLAPGVPGFLDLVLGGPFVGWVSLSVDPLERLAMAWKLLLGDIGWPSLVLAAVGVAWLALAQRMSTRASLAFLGLIGLLTLAFNLLYTIFDIAVLFLPVFLVLLLFAATGVGFLAHLPRSRSIQLLVIVPCFAFPVWLGSTHYLDLDRSHSVEARVQWDAIASAPLPADAILVGPDPNEMMPFWYLQYVEGRRTDLLNLFALTTPEYPTLSHVLDLALSTDRPVYLIRPIPGIQSKVRTVPNAGLWHVLGPAVEGEPVYRHEAVFGDLVVLHGYDRLPRSPQPGQSLQVSLYWEPLRPLQADYHTFVHLVDGEGNGYTASDHLSAFSEYAALSWRSDELLRDDHALSLPADIRPGTYRMLVGLYTIAPDGAVELVDEPVVVGQLGIKAGLQTQAPPMQHLVEASFAGQVELLGYDLGRRDGQLALTLHWRSLESVSTDYTVFAHVLDPSGKIVTQQDGQPRSGTYPTSVWDSDEVITDEHQLALPSALQRALCLSPGASGYRLRVGLYVLETDARLGVVGGGDYVELELEPWDWCP